MRIDVAAFWRGSQLYCAFVRKREPDPTQHPYATATTPDQIIGAAVMQSMAREFDDWTKVIAEPNPKHREYRYLYADEMRDPQITLANKKKKIVFTYKYDAGGYAVDGVRIDDEVGKEVVRVYHDLYRAREEAIRVAEDAKAAMIENEKKWGLAEKLLGMKRTPEGALIPAIPAEPDQ